MVVFSQVIPAWRASADEDSESVFVKFLFQDRVIISLMVVGCVLSGLGQACMWVTQGDYISNCATNNTKGFYFGFFWFMYMSSNIFGNWIGSYLILQTSGPVFFIIMGIIMIIGQTGFLGLQKPKSIEPVNQQQQELLEHDDVETDQEESFMQVVKNVWKLTFRKKMMLVNLQSIWSGGSIAFWSSALATVLVFQLKDTDLSDTEKESKAMTAMIAFGFGEVIGGVIFGVVIDIIGTKNTCLLNTAVCAIQGLVSIYSIGSGNYDIFSLIMCFLWGFGDAGLNIHCFTIMGFEFESKSVPFSVFLTLNGIGVTIFAII